MSVVERCLSGYEIRANVFMDRVRDIEKEVLETHPSILSVIVIDADKADKELSDSEREKVKDFHKELGEEWIPPELRGETVVRIDASSDLYEPFKKFVNKTLDLAHKQGGRINGDSKLLSDKEREDLIVRNDIETGETWFTSTFFFTFDENLPGSI